MSKQVDYFYHATSFENFRKIISDGFLFDNESKGVYLADDISHSLMFGWDRSKMILFQPSKKQKQISDKFMEEITLLIFVTD